MLTVDMAREERIRLDKVDRGSGRTKNMLGSIVSLGNGDRTPIIVICLDLNSCADMATCFAGFCKKRGKDARLVNSREVHVHGSTVVMEVRFYPISCSEIDEWHYVIYWDHAALARI